MSHNSDKSRKKHVVKSGIHIVLIFILLALPNLVTERWADQVYHPYVFQPISHLLIGLSGWNSFPIGQLLFYGFLAFSMIWIIKNLRHAFIKKSWRLLLKPAKKLLLAFALIYFLFQLTWGINYKRTPLAQELELDTSQIKQQELIDLANHYINLNNQMVMQIKMPFADRNMTQLKAGAVSGYSKLSQKIEYFQLHKANAKAVFAPRLMSYFGLGGIYFPFTAEANINTHKPPLSQPFTIAHELAHQIGIASEDEANFTAFLVGRNSDSLDFQFAANYTAMRYCMAYVADSTIQLQLHEKCNPALIEIMEYNQAYWEKYRGFFSHISNWVNDSFLKMNGQKEGIKSYGLFVKLLVGWERKYKKH